MNLLRRKALTKANVFTKRVTAMFVASGILMIAEAIWGEIPYWVVFAPIGVWIGIWVALLIGCAGILVFHAPKETLTELAGAWGISEEDADE